MCFGSFGLCRTSFEKPHHLHWKLSPFPDSLQNLSPHRLYGWECAVLFVTICVDVNGSTHRRRSRRSRGRRHLSIVFFDFCGCRAERRANHSYKRYVYAVVPALLAASACRYIRAQPCHGVVMFVSRVLIWTSLLPTMYMQLYSLFVLYCTWCDTLVILLATYLWVS